MKFSGLCLITNNVSSLANFYAGVLGVKPVGDDVHVELNADGVNLTIFSVEGMEKMAPGSMQGAGCGSITIGFEVENVDEEFVRLQAFGVNMIMPPTTHPWGCRSFWFKDLDGNIIDFYASLKG